MAKLAKRTQAIRSKVDRAKHYSADEALALAKDCATAKFTESVDVAVQLGVDAKNLTRSFVAPLSFPRVRARPRALLSLLRVRKPNRPRPQALKKLAWKILPKASRPGSWISM